MKTNKLLKEPNQTINKKNMNDRNLIFFACDTKKKKRTTYPFNLKALNLNLSYEVRK